MFQSVKNNFRRIFLKNYCENMLSEIFFFKFYFFQNFSFFETKELTSTVTIVLFLLSIYIWSMKYFCLAIKYFFDFNSLQNVAMFQSVKNNFRRIFLKYFCENMSSEIFFDFLFWKFCQFFKILSIFQNFADFSKFCQFFKILSIFQNFSMFSIFSNFN